MRAASVSGADAFPHAKGGTLCTRTRARVPRECGIRADGEAARSLFRTVSQRPGNSFNLKVDRLEPTMPLDATPSMQKILRTSVATRDY